ncbi:MAG: DUF2283 domain-containing protein [Gemmatimonadaceae bacterium]
MKLSYDRETDSLYMLLVDRPGADVVEVAAGVVADVDEAGEIVGFDLDHASRFFDEGMLERQSVTHRASNRITTVRIATNALRFR